jgi:hypothetical protein
MTPRAKEALAVVDERRMELAAAASTEQVRTKLGNLHEVCRSLVVEASQRPTIPEVIRRYKARFPTAEQSLAEQSLRNKRNGSNPYIILYKAWVGAAEFVLAPSRPRKHQPSADELLSEEDVAGISDDALRHQVGLVLAQNRSLKSQLDILKTLGNAPVVRMSGDARLQGGQAPLANHLALTEAEVEAVEHFIDRRRLNARGLARGEDGAIEWKDGRPFSAPGLADALEKIVKSYRR